MEYIEESIIHESRRGSTMTRLSGVSLSYSQIHELKRAGYVVSTISAPHPNCATDPTEGDVFIATEISWLAQ
jgi:hypothetical protein